METFCCLDFKTMDFDVVIVGGGLAGAALAVALRGSALKVALVEARTPTDSEGWDQRIYAISPANQLFLEELGCWKHLDQTRIAPVSQMLVRGDGDGRLRFSAQEEGLTALAWILEAGLMQREFRETLRRQHNVEVLMPARVAALTVTTQEARLRLDDGKTLTAKLVVGADGVASKVRTLAGIEFDVTPYEQSAVVANFRCGKPHYDTAYQWFRDGDVLAYLPLPDDGMSMVWSVSETMAAQLLALDERSLCDLVASAGDDVLGKLRLETPAAAFPLRLLRVAASVRPRIALIGDAAHAIHPLSGHGINLGFQDVRTLAQILRELPAWRDPGDTEVLRGYARARAEEPLLLQYGTHALQRLFKSDNMLLSMFRNTGMNLTDRFPVLKSVFVRYATGRKI